MNVGPEVTVVVPTRNRWNRIERTLRSVAAQESVRLELIVIDDCSDEPAPERINSIVSTLGRIVRVDAPAGTTRALNHGIRLARGGWIAFLSDDDIWSPQKLRAQLDAAHAEQADFGYSSVVVVDDNLDVITISRAPPSASETRMSMYTRNPIAAGGSNVIARTDLLRRLGGFDEKLTRLADWDMWIRLAEAGTGAVCPEVLVGYVMHSQNQVVVAERSSASRDLEYLLAKHEPARLARGVKLDLTWFFEWVAGGDRRAGRKWSAMKLYLSIGLRTRSIGFLGRGIGVLLGERALALGRRLRRRREQEAPAWIAAYR